MCEDSGTFGSMKDCWVAWGVFEVWLVCCVLGDFEGVPEAVRSLYGRSSSPSCRLEETLAVCEVCEVFTVRVFVAVKRAFLGLTATKGGRSCPVIDPLVLSSVTWA